MRKYKIIIEHKADVLVHNNNVLFKKVLGAVLSKKENKR